MTCLFWEGFFGAKFHGVYRPWVNVGSWVNSAEDLPRCCGHPGVHPDVGGTVPREGTREAAADGDLPLRAGAFLEGKVAFFLQQLIKWWI